MEGRLSDETYSNLRLARNWFLRNDTHSGDAEVYTRCLSSERRFHPGISAFYFPPLDRIRLTATGPGLTTPRLFSAWRSGLTLCRPTCAQGRSARTKRGSRSDGWPPPRLGEASKDYSTEGANGDDGN